jgi:hypothetical protein
MLLESFYKSSYSQGSTECQDESPYEYDNDEIECKEMTRIEKVVYDYIPKV